MRGIVILTAAFVIGLSPIIGESNEVYGPVPVIPVSLNGSDWQRIDPGMWEITGADGKSTQYKVESKSDGALVLFYSTDGVKWEAKHDQVWKDADENQFRIIHNKVVFSDDGGASWSELNHCIWKDAQGHWLMLDREGRVWRMKETQ